MPHQTDRLTVLERRFGRIGASSTRSRPPLNWLLIWVWTAALVICLATWLGVAMAVLALVR